MSYILVIIIAIVISMIGISQYSAFKAECSEIRVRYSFLILSFCIAMCSVMLVVMMVTYGSRICFIMYAIDKFFKVCIMGFIVFLTQNVIGVDKKYTSTFVSVMAYSTVALFIADTFFQGGELSRGLFGVYFVPRFVWVKILYVVYYMLYDVVLLAFVIYKASIIYKSCHRHEYNLLFLTYSFSAVGFSMEFFGVLLGGVYIPFALIFNLVATILLRNLLNYHESISIEQDAFKVELDPASLDITFILDDELNIIYQNKRAEVFSQIFNDEYIGRKLSDVFVFNDNAYGQMNINTDKVPFGITAEYRPNNHKVNMVIQHKIDRYGDILASVVYVYNMEDEIKGTVTNSKEDGEEAVVTDSVLSITRNARVLVVDDDVVFSNIMTRLLKQYEVVVERAFGGREGINQIKDNVYDMIFIALEMNRSNGDEIVREIRTMNGEYYRQVPIVFLIQTDINTVFDKIVDTGFNDYMLKPINNKNLSLVLTRWLWQRFDDSKVSMAKASNTIDAHYYELSELLNSADAMLQKKDYINFDYVIKGIFRCAVMIGMIDVAVMVKKLQTAILIKNTVEITRLYNLISKDIRDIITI